MARKRRGRPKKKPITYDSKETRFVIAIFAFLIGIFALLTYLINDSEGVFGFIRSLFGGATILFGALMLNLSLSLFGAKYPFSSKKSLIAQVFLLLLLAAVMSTKANPLDAFTQSYQGQYGGAVGYEISDFSRNYILLNLTRPVFILLMIMLLPAIFSQSMSEFFNNVFFSIKRFIEFMLGRKEKQDEPVEEVEELGNMKSPTMVGDLMGVKKAIAAVNPLKSKESLANQNSADNESAQKNAPDFVGISSNPKHLLNGDELDFENEEGEDVHSTAQSELKYPNWKLPPIDLLDEVPVMDVPEEDIKNNSTIIEQTLASFGIESKVMDVRVGPSVSQYALDIALGIKVSKISNLRNDLALALATSANSVRIEVPIPGTSYVGIEIPNARRRPVFIRELLDDPNMKDPKHKLPASVGKDIAGTAIVADIQKMPHLLIAGATGSGKSVLTNSFIASLLMRRTPDEVKFIMVDPKQVELSDYNGIPHLLTPVIVDMGKVLNALKWTVAEMERRYTLFREESVRNLEGYNENMGFAALPYIVVVIDEMADMMLTTGKVDIETNIVRLAQKARATGIHLILATQRPSVNVITGLIKANIPGRIGMSVTTSIDSRVILDVMGAESLLGKGDMLFKEPDKSKPYRVQGVLVTQEEIQRVVKFIKNQTSGEVEYLDDVIAEPEEPMPAGAQGSITGDNLFSDAIRVIVSAQKGSASLLQRKLSIGYNRAAKLIDEMAEIGVVGPANGSKPREVLITDAEGFIERLKQG